MMRLTRRSPGRALHRFARPAWWLHSALLVSLALSLGAALGCSQKPTVLVLGLDGADWDILDPLMEEGHVPTLASLVASGARADFDCRPAAPSFSCYCPPIWVSIVTGQPHDRHRILQITQPQSDRRSPALWEVVEANGGWSALVSYRNTFPVHRGRDFVLSEPVMSWAVGENFDVPAIDPPDPFEDGVHPPDLLDQLGLLPISEHRPLVPRVVGRDRVAMEAVYRIASLTSLAAQFGVERPRLTLVLLHAIDKVEHITWPLVQAEPDDPVDRAAVLELAEAWSGPIENEIGNPASQYIEIDRWLGLLLEAVSYDYIAIVSDHGMTRSRLETGLPGAHGPTSVEAHSGVFAIRGPGIPAGSVLSNVDVLDVAPTVAYALGLPVAEDLEGDVLLEAFTASWRAEHPVSFVPSW